MKSDRRPPALVFLLLAAVTTSLAVRAWLAPPRGRVFVGTFYYVGDFYNYLASVEQAQRGALLFRSKLAAPALPASLLNLEWLAVGWLSALLGGRPLLAYRLVGLAALLVLVALASRWLARCGVPTGRRTAALLLVFTGGGLGGALVALGVLPGERAWDVRTGAFPFVEAMANPHFVVGTALLAAALAAGAAGRPRLAALLGVVLGLVRPYDAALLLAVELFAIVLMRPRREWPSRLLPLLALLPVLTYSAWVFLASSGFRVFSSPAYAALSPSPVDLAIALGPALTLALAAWPAWRDGTAEVREHLGRLALWALAALAVVVLRPASFALQVIVGVGLPLLAIAAVGLARRGRLLEAAIVPMAGTAVFVGSLCGPPSPPGTTPEERWLVARALRDVCRPGDLVVSPADVGLFAGGLAPCWPYLSHPAAADYGEHEAAVRAFYDPRTSSEARARWLDARCPAHVVVPTPLPAGWLGDAYEPRLAVRGETGALAVWSRVAGRPCSSGG
ncbi:MAG TPA: hypothetical protein VMX54_07125 [Vicinamibacteria bacterium]|nr:hypothetical protein [Vicinamibacteria bacterium]